MKIQSITDSLKDCPCGKVHTTHVKAVEIGSGLLQKAGKILSENSFPKRLLVVADQNTLGASDGITEVLKKEGFEIRLKLYDDLRTADTENVERIRALLRETDAVLSVGTGSLNDICRRASFLEDKPFAIFATAPSMDGFASDSAPIIVDHFKISLEAKQPDVIIADTAVLAAAPAHLKSAGFGDMIAKYIGLADWRISNLLTGEYYCENVANVTREALRRITALADRVQDNDEATAGAIMEALVLTGCAMQYAHCTRPASGAEHVVSHFWEIKKLEQGIISDFHGKKVGVATVMASRLYHDLAARENITFCEPHVDWQKVYAAYGETLSADVVKMNTPPITDGISPEKIAACWNGIREIITEEIPPCETLVSLMERAGAPMTLESIAVTPELGLAGLTYHPYMRHRLYLTRLTDFMKTSPDYASYIQL